MDRWRRPPPRVYGAPRQRSTGLNWPALSVGNGCTRRVGRKARGSVARWLFRSSSRSPSCGRSTRARPERPSGRSTCRRRAAPRAHVPPSSPGADVAASWAADHTRARAHLRWIRCFIGLNWRLRRNLVCLFVCLFVCSFAQLASSVAKSLALLVQASPIRPYSTPSGVGYRAGRATVPAGISVSPVTVGRAFMLVRREPCGADVTWYVARGVLHLFWEAVSLPTLCAEDPLWPEGRRCKARE